MQKSVLNKQGNFGVKILWRYTDMAIFVLRCFILTHPVNQSAFIHSMESYNIPGFFFRTIIKFQAYIQTRRV